MGRGAQGDILKRHTSSEGNIILIIMTHNLSSLRCYEQAERFKQSISQEITRNVKSLNVSELMARNSEIVMNSVPVL